MCRPTPFCFRTTYWLILAGTLLAASGCTRSNASPGGAHAAPAQASQPTQVRSATAQVAQPTVSPSSEFAELEAKARAGDSNAMYRLGRMYAAGTGVERDYVEAFNWYKRAAKAGNSDAMYSLGEAYEHGLGVRDDIQKAVNWYDQATLRGNKSAKAALDRLGESFDR